jgi:hypothetical protein
MGCPSLRNCLPSARHRDERYRAASASERARRLLGLPPPAAATAIQDDCSMPQTRRNSDSLVLLLSRRSTLESPLVKVLLRARRDGAAASTLSFWSLPRMRQRQVSIGADTGRAEPRFASPAVLQAAPDRDLLSAELAHEPHLELAGSQQAVAASVAIHRPSAHGDGRVRGVAAGFCLIAFPAT